MPDAALSQLITSLIRARAITADDTLAVRRLVYGPVEITREAAGEIIALDEAVDDRAPEWSQFFVEAMTDYVVHQQDPDGYVDDAKAAWVIYAFGHDGRIRTDSELEALAAILHSATSVPPRLAAFALAQVKAALIDGEGPLLRGGAVEKGRISAGEVALLSRILYAAGGDGNTAITRAEAEALFDINDACRSGDNDPAWTELFSKALAASVMTVSGYQPRAREAALRDEAWLNSKESLGSFIGAMFHKPDVGGALRDILHPDADYDDAWAQENTRFEAADAAARPVSDEEAAWLVERIGRDGFFDEAERRLIAFLKENSLNISPALQPLLDKAA